MKLCHALLFVTLIFNTLHPSINQAPPDRKRIIALTLRALDIPLISSEIDPMLDQLLEHMKTPPSALSRATLLMLIDRQINHVTTRRMIIQDPLWTHHQIVHKIFKELGLATITDSSKESVQHFEKKQSITPWIITTTIITAGYLLYLHRSIQRLKQESMGIRETLGASLLAQSRLHQDLLRRQQVYDLYLEETFKELVTATENTSQLTQLAITTYLPLLKTVQKRDAAVGLIIQTVKDFFVEEGSFFNRPPQEKLEALTNATATLTQSGLCPAEVSSIGANIQALEDHIRALKSLHAKCNLETTLATLLLKHQ